jgi:hypothetical protein
LPKQGFDFRLPGLPKSLQKLTKFPVLRQEEEVTIVDSNHGDIQLEFRGFTFLGTPYGVLYWRELVGKRSVENRNVTTMLGQTPQVFSAALRRAVVTKSRFETLLKSKELAHVLVVKV